MFFVFNKEKILAYVVSVLTVCLLFFIASSSTEKVTETSSNIEVNYNVVNDLENTVNNIVK